MLNHWQAVTVFTRGVQNMWLVLAYCMLDSTEQMIQYLTLIQNVKAWWFATNNHGGIAEACLLVCRCLDYWAIRLIEISFTMLLIDPEYPLYK